VFVGGRHKLLLSAFQDSLRAHDFIVKRHLNAKLQGISQANICNRGISGAGVQLELSRGFRKTLFESLSLEGREHPTPRLPVFVAAVRHALHNF
jgi:phage replication-related protein YjqB (UPF0714/DUF867 family)